MKFVTSLLFITFSCASHAHCQSNSQGKIKATSKVKPKPNASANYQSRPSEAETKDWIKNKIENFSHDYNESSPETHIGRYGSLKYEVEFHDCNMTIWEKDALYYKNVFTEKYTKYYYNKSYEIPLKEISNIQFSQEGKYMRMIFKIKSNENLIKEMMFTDMPSPSTNKMVNLSNVSIPSRFFENDLSSRFTKAINHLVLLCGGKIIRDVF